MQQGKVEVDPIIRFIRKRRKNTVQANLTDFLSEPQGGANSP